MQYEVTIFHRRTHGRRLGTIDTFRLARRAFGDHERGIAAATEVARKLFPEADSITVEEIR